MKKYLRLISVIALLFACLTATSCKKTEYKVFYFNDDRDGIVYGIQSEYEFTDTDENASMPEIITAGTVPNKSFLINGTEYELEAKERTDSSIIYYGKFENNSVTVWDSKNNRSGDKVRFTINYIELPKGPVTVSNERALSVAESYLYANFGNDYSLYNEIRQSKFRTKYVFSKKVNGFFTEDMVDIGVDLYTEEITLLDFVQHGDFDGISAFKNANVEEIEALVYNKYEEIVEKAKNSYLISPYEDEKVRIELKYKNGFYYLEYTFPVRVKDVYRYYCSGRMSSDLSNIRL